MTDLPKKGELVKLDHVRIDRNAGNVCRCSGEKKIVINAENNQVYCGKCGALMDAFQVLWEMAMEDDWRNRQMERWLEQAEELANYKPWLKTVRRIEKKYRGRKWVPDCPRCKVPFYLEELVHWSDRRLADKRINDWREQNG